MDGGLAEGSFLTPTASALSQPEVNLSGLEASHDPEGSVKTCFLFNFAPIMGYLLCVIDCYHSDVTVKILADVKLCIFFQGGWVQPCDYVILRVGMAL